MTDSYDIQQIERKWQQRWKEKNLFATRNDPGRRNFYYLDMFPYPSGKLHMGHMRNYTIGDVVARYHVMRGENVLHPMGWDAFGLPAENAAIKNQTHPREWTHACIAEMHNQFGQMGISFDWDREISTCEPEYYGWNQWLFLQMYRRGLAYRRGSFVNWCPSCATVLANEQVKQGLCERCDALVTKKQLEQWFFKITDYAQQLLDDLEALEHWPERVKTMQRKWIGRSEGVQFRFTLPGLDSAIEVFTTRIDTVFGVTFMVLAPEHPLVEALLRDSDREAEARAFVQKCMAQSEIERGSAEVAKEGVFTGQYAVSPVNGEQVPIWIANYVLMEYGTGAVMAVPAHDQRDFEFARQYGIPVRAVIQPEGEVVDGETMEEAYVEAGVQVNSGQFDGLSNIEAQTAIAKFMESSGIGRRTVNYRLRDWCLSRQRYWGTPIPILYCDTCGLLPAPEDQLPVLLPTDVEFTVGVNPLTTSPTFAQTSCPQCGGSARRETDTMDTFVDSSWYMLRFASPHAGTAPFDRDDVERWLPVDQYVGGVEHATMHLIYARFFTKVLNDLGLVKFREPFTHLFTQGMIGKATYWCSSCRKYLNPPADLAEPEAGKTAACPSCEKSLERRVEKMSKSIGNLVTADSMCQTYGADTARTYVLFVGPPDNDGEWSDEGVSGVYRFLNRVWRLVALHAEGFDPDWRNHVGEGGEEYKTVRRKVHQTAQKVTRDIERFAFNTGISAMMELVNVLTPFAERIGQDPTLATKAVFSEAVEYLILGLSPFAPHLSEELWALIGKQGSAYQAAWLDADPELAKEEEVTIVVQLNGKVRDRLLVQRAASRQALEQLALDSPVIKTHLDGKNVRKVIVVPDKLVNIVAG
ncbi:MAG: leucine--tRNA ligase [Armatimonadetes bacterium]|nr:leucine--tRNA ligase [Armatimonadota bacterium]